MKATLLLLLLVADIAIAQKNISFPAGTNLCDTGTWKLVWGDEFDSNGLDKKKWYTFIDDDNWVNDVVVDTAISEASRRGTMVIYKDQNVVVKHGICSLNLRYEPSTWKTASRNFSSGLLVAKIPAGTSPLYFQGGRFEIKAKLPKATGVWATFWLYGGGDPNNIGSEIDMLEYAPCRSALNTIPYHLHGFRRGNSHEDHYEIDGDYRLNAVGNWHIYTTEWDTHFIRLYVDGGLKAVLSRYDSGCQPEPGKLYIGDRQNVFPRIDEGMKLVVTLDYTANLYSTSIAGICTPLPAWLKNRQRTDARQPERSFEIDYIRVYQREGKLQDVFRR